MTRCGARRVFALSAEGEVARTSERRTAAKIALFKGDIAEKIKRALRRAPAGERRSFQPGGMVYCWSPAKPHDRRYRRDQGAWRGPAVVLVPDGTERFFVSWRGRCLLLSAANLKGATVEEAGRHDLRLDQTNVDLKKGYVDLTGEPPPPALDEEEAPFSVQAPGVLMRRRSDGTGRKLSEARRMMAGLKSVKKVLKRPLEGFRRRRVLPARARRQPGGGRSRGAANGRCGGCACGGRPVVPPGDQVESRAVAEDDVWQDAPPLAMTYDHLHDVPAQVRMQLRKCGRASPTERRDPPEEPDLKRVRTTDFVLMAVSEGELQQSPVRANEWLSKREVDKSSWTCRCPRCECIAHLGNSCSILAR